MSLIVTAPVAERHWILPRWFECLAEQSVRPDEIMLLHSGDKGDKTWQAINDAAARHSFTIRRLHDPERPRPRHDNGRFHTLTRLRNMILASATLTTDHDALFSLDTDILLEAGDEIERLLARLSVNDADVVSPRLYLHPDMRWTTNAGLLTDKHNLAAAARELPELLNTWGWTRIPEGVAFEAEVPIDVPMAAVMMSRPAYRHVRYRWHEAGEDLGFAINLALAGMEAKWLPRIECRHVWNEARL